jgi:hypothetical protein
MASLFSDGKRPFGKSMHRWEDNINMNLKAKVRLWTAVIAQDRAQ